VERGIVDDFTPGLEPVVAPGVAPPRREVVAV